MLSLLPAQDGGSSVIPELAVRKRGAGQLVFMLGDWL